MKWLLAMALVGATLASGSGPAAADDVTACPPPLVPLADAPGVCVSPEPWEGTPTPPLEVATRPEPQRPDLRPHARPTGTDLRPCVSTREFRGAKTGDLRQFVESRWEVVSLGHRRAINTIGRAIVYPRCGYDTTEAWYAVQYDHGKAHIFAEWKDEDAILHGRP